MPVTKYKSFDEARSDLWIMQPGAEYYKKLSGIFELFQKLHKSEVENKLTRYKSIEEAEQNLFFSDIKAGYGKLNKNNL